MHAQHITDQQLTETRTNTPHDTIVSGQMSPEKPNAGKPVQLSEGFLIKQYQSIIRVPKLAYPTENFLNIYTSQFERNLLAETPENPFGSSSAQNCSATPIAQSALRQPLSVSHWPSVILSRPMSAPGGFVSPLGAFASVALAPLVLCATLGCLCVALHEPCWLCVTLLGYYAALPTQSLPSLFLCQHSL